MMDETRFRVLAEAYGGDLQGWPAAEQAAARAFLEGSEAQARTILAEARMLDGLLAGAGAIEPPAGLEAAILAAAPGAQPSAPRWAGLAAALALMVGAGAGWFAAPGSDPYDDAIFADAFGALDSVDSLSELDQEEAR